MTALGLSALLASYAGALIVLKIVGGLYLLWLAYKSFRQAASAHGIELTSAAQSDRTPVRYYLRGFIIQMTNPKAAFTWIAIISLGVQTDASIWVALTIVGGTTLLAALVHCAYAFAFSTSGVVRVYNKVRRYVQGALGMFFAFAGVKLLTSRL